MFELQVRSFRNDLGLTSNGTCCNGFRQNGICSAPCRTFFKVCLAHYQADIAVNPRPRCTFANYTSPVLGDNSMDFSILSGLPVPGSRQNTFYFPVKEFSWPVSSLFLFRNDCSLSILAQWQVLPMILFLMDYLLLRGC